MANVTLENICKQYDKTPTLRDINLNIANEEFVVLVGPSGCGKTTILRMIAGLEAITEGEIRINDKVVNNLAPKDRDIAMVFQSYALYPHMSVYDNMAFGLKMRKTPKAVIKEKVTEAARILDLSHLLDRKPRQLSGGQRQRVALGRAIVRNPQVFLMDEPLSNLDAKLRVQMRMEILKLHRSLKATTIYVTHDQTEAMTMGDRIVVLNAGIIQQVGCPQEIYTRPANMFVASFIGHMDFVPARLEDQKLHFKSGLALPMPPQFFNDPRFEQPLDIQMGIRPEHFQSMPQSLPIQVVPDLVENLGAEQHIHFTWEDQSITASMPSTIPIDEGQPSTLFLAYDRCNYFDASTQKNLF